MPKTTKTQPAETPALAKGQIWEDTFISAGKLHEWVEVLHVGSKEAIVQRRNGLGRYPNGEFAEGRRFKFVTAEEASA